MKKVKNVPVQMNEKDSAKVKVLYAKIAKDSK